MSAKQGRLFDEPEEPDENSGEWQAPPNARTSDPETSHKAGRKIERSGKADAQRSMVLACMERVADPRTFAELANNEACHRFKCKPCCKPPELDALLLELKMIFHRRLPDLRGRKLVHNSGKRTCMIDGNSKQLWKLGEAPTDE